MTSNCVLIFIFVVTGGGVDICSSHCSFRFPPVKIVSVVVNFPIGLFAILLLVYYYWRGSYNK